MKIKIIHENCDPDLAMDVSLPYTAYLVEYLKEGVTSYDIAVSSKQVDIFDHYYDKYSSVINMTQSNGKVNPKLWIDPKAKKKK